MYPFDFLVSILVHITDFVSLSGTAQKKKPAKPQGGGNIVGMAASASQNIIAPSAPGQGMSKSARRRANKKKKMVGDVSVVLPS